MQGTFSTRALRLIYGIRYYYIYISIVLLFGNCVLAAAMDRIYMPVTEVCHLVNCIHTPTRKLP